MITAATNTADPERSVGAAQIPPFLAHPIQGSCVNCRRRKVKCDKLSPCSNCLKSRSKCEFAPRKRAPRRFKNVGGEGPSGREAELLKRLNKLEGMVKDLSAQVDDEDTRKLSTITSGTDDSTSGHTRKSGVDGSGPGRAGSAVSGNSECVGEPQIEEELGTLMIDDGKSRYVSHNFWLRLNAEVDDIRNLVIDDTWEDEEDESSPSATSASSENDHLGFIFKYSSCHVNLRPLHPLPSQLPYYLQVYTERVDPLMKLLHIPTMKKTIKEAQESFDSLSRSKEALMFALYFSVITSMSAEEVKSNFGLEKKSLNDRYNFGVEQALARADFLDSSELVTLQAFVLYLGCVYCQAERRFGWNLTMSAIGVAQSLGLHRDGSNFGLPPFESEMRRRLWWQLCILDFRNAEKHSTDASIDEDSFDTKLPLNINDSDLSQDATVLPEARIGLTEMSLTLVACDVSSTVRRLQKSRPGLNNPGAENALPATFAQKEGLVHEFRQMLEDKYLQHCNDDSATSWALSIMCRLIINKIALMMYLPLTRSQKDSIPKDNSDRMFVLSIKVVEDRRNLEVEKTKHWHWLIHTFVQWHSIAYLLGEVCVREPDDKVTEAWAVLDRVFQDWKTSQVDRALGMLRVPMKKLIAKARRKRELDLAAARETVASRNQLAGFDNPAAGQNTEVTTELPGMDFANTEGAQTFFAMQDSFHASSQKQTSGVGPYQEHWLQEQQLFPAETPTPWLLEDSALEQLGLDMDILNDNMEWEGLDDLIQEFQMEGATNPDTAVSGLGTLW